MKYLICALSLWVISGFLYLSQKVGASDTKTIHLHELDSVVVVRLTRTKFDVIIGSDRAQREVKVERRKGHVIEALKGILRTKAKGREAEARELLQQEKETVFLYRDHIRIRDIKAYTLSRPSNAMHIDFKHHGSLTLTPMPDGRFELK
jgi:hypothetical protein